MLERGRQTIIEATALGRLGTTDVCLGFLGLSDHSVSVANPPCA